MKIFTEEQRFNQWWLYLILGGALVAVSLPLIIDFKEISNDSAAKMSFLISFLLVLMVILLIFMLQLRTRIDEKGIHYQFFPIHRNYKTIVWNDISNVYVRKYRPISEYGGWGYRGGFIGNRGRGKAFNVKGNQGIQIILKNGKKILIGTQKEVDAQKTINTYKSKTLKSKE